MLRVGIVGIGFGKAVHAPAFVRDARACVAAICASSEERAAQAAQALGIKKSYGNWRDLVADSEIDAVSIATSPIVQSEIAIEALQRGKPVFLEKPLAHSLDAAREMARLAREKKIANMIDFEFSELATFQKAKEIINDGSIGNVHHAAISWQVETYANRLGLASWRTDVEPGGGALNLFASHTFYYLEWLLGPISELRCSLGAPPQYKGTADTFVSLSLRMASGALVTVAISTASPSGSGHRLEFYGSDGALILVNEKADYMKGFCLMRATRKEPELKPVAAPEPGFDEADGRILAVSKLTKRFVDWALEGKESRPSLDDGLRVQSLIAASRLSHGEASWAAVERREAAAGIQ